MTIKIESNGRTREFDELTTEWRDGKVHVYGWGTWGRGSLEGQPMKSYLDTFDTQEEAEAAYPDATASHPLLQPQNTFDHLPDDQDY